MSFVVLWSDQKKKKKLIESTKSENQPGVRKGEII